MTRATPSASASSAPTKSFEKVFGQPGGAVETTSGTRCQVYAFEAYVAPRPQPPAKHSSISQLIDEWEQDGKSRAALEDGRRWLADTFYGEEGDTMRTLRLRKGWSQIRLAEALGTSQSHVARIERGTENLTIETCRKLCSALDIDMNTLDRMLKRQEAIAQAKQK
jgi:ribosome-binding protein aMBF1 (putative translation factor)